MKILILHDQLPENPRPDELDSLVPARKAAEVLEKAGYEVSQLPLTFNFSLAVQQIKDTKPDFVFNFVESIEGRATLNYLTPMVIELAGCPYYGCSQEALYVTSNKILTKQIIRATSLPTPPWVFGEEGKLSKRPLYIVKSTHEDASVGIEQTSVVRGEKVRELMAERSSRFGGQWFAERYIDGREFNIGLLANGQGPQVLPLAEIVFKDYGDRLYPIVDYSAKWVEDSFEYQHSCRTFELAAEDSSLVERLQSLALRLWEIFGLSGYARVDFRIDKNGNPWILEINCNPGIAPDSGFIASCEKAGISYLQLLERLIASGRDHR